MSQQTNLNLGCYFIASLAIKVRRYFVPGSRRAGVRWLIFASSVLYFLYFTQLLSVSHQPAKNISSVASVKVNRSSCCMGPQLLKDVCGRSNCTLNCPDPIQLPIGSINNNTDQAFFLETSGSGVLNVRQACAVESLAFHNPSLNVNVLFMDDDQNKINRSKVVNTIEKLKEKYRNIKFAIVSLDEFIAGTVLDKWYHCTDWRKGPYHVSHLSDGLRFLTLHKYGGYYFDLDVLVVRDVMHYRNFVAVESKNSLGSCVIHADLGSPLIKLSVQDFAANYSAGLWTHNGPLLLLRVLKSWCNVSDLHSMDYSRCHGFRVLPQTSFCPVHYAHLGKLFDTNQLSNNRETPPDWLTDEVSGIHTWNKLSYNRPIYKNSTQIYTLLARDHCPLSYSIASDVF